MTDAIEVAPREHLPAHAPRITDRLRDRVVMVYGGGAPGDAVSVGQAAAYAYARAGAQVIVADMNLENAERTQRQLASIGTDCMVLQADVTDSDSVSAATDRAVAEYGRIDILHNNVGVPGVREFESFDDEDWLKGMQLNCLGAVTTIRCTLPHLLANRRGVITNVSSVASIRYTGLNYSVYSTSKAALNRMTISVALEYADRGLRANAILPGLLDTNMGRALSDVTKQTLGISRDERSPTKFQGDAWDVANAAVFLASHEARYVNGHLLVVDGGLTARS